MILGGIDGCKAGWLVITYLNEKFDYHVIKHIHELNDLIRNEARVFIDMPMGLSSKGFERTLETSLRKELANRSSTIFSVPVRPAVYEENRDKAKSINKVLTGKSLSEQTLNIKDKILKIDQFIISNKAHTIELVESYPEICFKYLNGSIVQSKKSSKSGIEERLNILSEYDSNIPNLYLEILEKTLRKDIKRDDILDALCLCMANKLAYLNTISFIKDTNEIDEYGVAINIGFYKPKVKIRF